MDIDGSNQVNLTPKSDDVLASAWSSRAPGWSRNGQYIYFTAHRPVASVSENIFVMNADGTGVTPTDVHDCARSERRSGGAITPTESMASCVRLAANSLRLISSAGP